MVLCIMLLPHVRGVWNSNPVPVKSNTVLQMVRHLFNVVYTQVAVLSWRYVAEMGIENSLHTLK